MTNERDDLVPRLVATYLQQGRLMQIATIRGEQPWVCSVYYVAINNKVYWLSWPERRHSKELLEQPNVAIAIAVKTERPVIGLQAEGLAEVVSDAEEVKIVMQRYVAKYDEGAKFYDNFVAGKNKHHMYRFTARKFVLFDEVDFDGDGRREWQP